MSDILTREIIKRVIADVGAAPGMFGLRGLTDKGLRLVKTITVKYDDRDREHDLYAGKIAIKEGSYIKGLLVNLTVEDIDEYLFLFRMDELPIHAAQVSYDESYEEGTFIKRLNEKIAKDGETQEIWEPIGMFQKARLLGDFERIVSWGLLWEDCKEVSDLHAAAVKLIDAQRY